MFYATRCQVHWGLKCNVFFCWYSDFIFLTHTHTPTHTHTHIHTHTHTHTHTHQTQGPVDCDTLIWACIYNNCNVFIQDPNLETKIASQKNQSMVRKIACCRLIFGFLLNVLVNLQREFMKRVIVISLNLHLLLLFFQQYNSYYFYIFLAIYRRIVKNFGIPNEVKFSSSMWPYETTLNVKLCSKTTLNCKK